MMVVALAYARTTLGMTHNIERRMQGMFGYGLMLERPACVDKSLSEVQPWRAGLGRLFPGRPLGPLAGPRPPVLGVFR